jgi:hypothetical protein
VASSAVEICNLALSQAGAGGPIASLTEASNEAIECNLHYETCRDTVLRLHPWGWAQRRQALADLGTPPSGWAYRYQYPSDCLTLHAVRAGSYTATPDSWPAGWPLYDGWPLVGWPVLNSTVIYPPQPYEVGGDETGTARVILTNAPEATATFTAKITLPALFDPLFTDALVMLLASRITPRLTAKYDVQKMLYQLYLATVRGAAARDANEAQSVPTPDPDWMRAR